MFVLVKILLTEQTAICIKASNPPSGESIFPEILVDSTAVRNLSRSLDIDC